MYKQALIAAGGGAVSAFLFAGVTAGGVVLFAYFAPLPILAVGLTAGLRHGATAALVGLITAVILANGLHAALYGGVVVLPTWLVLRYALMHRVMQQSNVRWYPAGHILAYLAGLGSAFLILTAIAHFDVEGGFQGAVRGYVNELLALRFQAFSSEIDRQPLVERLVPLFPAYMIAIWLIMMVLNGVIAQGLLTRLGRNLRPTPSYSRIIVPEWLSWALAAAALVSLFSGGNVEYVARNLVIVLATPYFFVGLAIVHLLVRRLTLPGMALTVFYVFLVFLGWPAVAVAGLGFFEEWMGLRGKYGPPPSGQEDEDE